MHEAEWGPEKEELCRDGVQAAPAMRLERRGEGKQALPAITAGKIIKKKVFPVSSLRKSPLPSTSIGFRGRLHVQPPS